MKVLIITTALVAALISNSVNARSETIKCDTGFFSSKTFIIKEDEMVTEDLGYKSDFFGFEVDALHLSQETHLFEDYPGNHPITSFSNYQKYPSMIEWMYSRAMFQWAEADLVYTLWDSSKGWALKIKEKDWSSSEGDHWDEVLEKTYCK